MTFKIANKTAQSECYEQTVAGRLALESADHQVWTSSAIDWLLSQLSVACHHPRCCLATSLMTRQPASAAFHSIYHQRLQYRKLFGYFIALSISLRLSSFWSDLKHISSSNLLIPSDRTVVPGHPLPLTLRQTSALPDKSPLGQLSRTFIPMPV